MEWSIICYIDYVSWWFFEEGQLGYTFVDSQAALRRVSPLRSKIVSIVIADKHTIVVFDSGDIFTWGCNKEG